ncbi:hypothetical protein NKG99_20625 [Mesorhizobium sp. M1409]|uniref:hypothetical protein n=1 Tax=Mesorhizobium sp. M1409 TaxID=2957100 RepID=UPI003335B84A
MNDQTTTREERRSALDEFADQPTTKGEVVPLATYQPPSERHGAIKVEVARSLTSTRAAISEAAGLLGERGFYRWPVKNRRKGTTDWVEGVSIKGAMALVKAYKNCRVACPVVVDLGSHWRFHAVFIDYENGIEVERSFLQRKSAAKMGDDAERQLDMSYQIGISKAERNVVANFLEIEAEILLEECRHSIIDRVGDRLEYYRSTIVERAAKRGIELARIEAGAGRSAKDWLAPDMVRIMGMMAAVGDGMATLDETFPPLKVEDAKVEVTTQKELDHFAETDSDAPVVADPPAAASEPRTPSKETGAAAPDSKALQEEAITKLLQLADDPDLSESERLETLDGIVPSWEEKLPPDRHAFLRALISHSAKVARGEEKAADAKKYLQGLIK